jgi:alkanesulfonate monooxygenase SsuD/methylene tetrahydromethanopterin reductase-like flavin-dependent oxidoreductase (luciferase family)
MGKGGTQQEAGTFGYDLKELQPMIDEAMYLIPKIMVEDEIEHDGKYVKIPRRPIHPKPYQDPHPPLYLAVTNTETLVRAGSRGMGCLVLGFGGPEDVAKKNAVYREAWANRKVEDQVGYRPIQHLAALCPTIVLDDDAKARNIGIKGQRYFMESLAHWYTGGPKPDPTKWADDNLITRDGSGKLIMQTTMNETIETSFASEKVTVDFSDPGTALLNPNHAYGSVEDCRNYVGRLIESGADEILFICQMGSVPQWAQLDTIRNIGKYVIPYFRAQGK